MGRYNDRLPHQNVLTVKKLLGHKQVKNTMKYIGRIEFQSQDFETTSVSTVEDVLKLGSQGWTEYAVVKISNVEYHCFKKPKRFSCYMFKTPKMSVVRTKDHEIRKGKTFPHKVR